MADISGLLREVRLAFERRGLEPPISMRLTDRTRAVFNRDVQIDDLYVRFIDLPISGKSNILMRGIEIE